MARKTASYYDYRTPYGRITIGVSGKAISAVQLGKVELEGAYRPSDLANTCATELLEYFAGLRRTFDLPLKPAGSDFQRRVWRALGTIPYGQTRTSSDIARAIARPESFRMVGTAVRSNPIAVLIPAHRIVGANGRTPGADKPARMRAALLEMERRNL